MDFFSSWLKADGGTIQEDNNNPNKQALCDGQILELTSLIKKCENYYEKPMDIEWAFEKEKLYLLQSRPITTHLPLFPELLTKPGEAKNIYIDIMGLTQGFTQSMSVLGLDLWKELIGELKGGIMPTTLDGIAPAVHGRQYINVSNIMGGWGSLAAKQFVKRYDESVKKIFKNIDLDKEYKPDKVSKEVKKIKFNIFKIIFPMIPSTLKAKFANYKEL